MRRREFLAAAGALALAKRSRAEIPNRRPSPYESLLRYIDAGTDDFPAEKAALDLEARLARMFRGEEKLPAALQKWAGAKSARFYALPDNLVRFEITQGTKYHTGLWRAPEFTAVLEETVTASPFFRDVTGHVFGGSDSFREQLLKGNPWWRARLDSAAGIDVYGNQGIAAGDIDGDGVDEVYVCQPGGLPDRLYKFRADGTAEDITGRAGLGILDETTCALFLDLRNSGRQDLVVLRSSGPLLFLNRGNGVFQESPNAFRFARKPQGSFTGMAAADYDRDGKLDLYLCCYVYFQSEDQYQYPAPYHDARNGPPNFLFHNRLTADGGAFEDVTEASGIDENNDRFSFAPAWCDFDGDGWPDLYVANDFGRNNLYRNREGRFRDEAAKAGVEDIGPGMSVSWFDYDGDGRADLYISNMWTAAGQRVTRDAAFHPAAQFREAYRRHTKGNSLYRNRGDGTFEEMGPAEKVEMGRWAWASGAFDFDYDGSPEIYSVAGMTTNPDARDLNSFFWRQVVAKSPAAARTAPGYENGWNAINQLIRQEESWCGREPNVFYARRDGRYRDFSGVSGIDFADDSRAFAVTDFDGDGCLDILLKNRLAPQVRALRNECGVGKPAIAISLRGVTSNRDAIGARVEVNGRSQWLAAGSGFLSQHSKTLYFGLNGETSAVVRIVWPSGLAQEVRDLEPGHRYQILEGSSQVTKTRFRERAAYPEKTLAALNAAERGDSWLLDPVPTPDTRKGPGFFVVDGREPEYSLLHRYLFEYRGELQAPLTLLIDAEGRIRKVYAKPPSDETRRLDLARINDSHKLALPFAGRYYSEPRRNYFKLGAAFYWAGYPERALPYLNETVRAQPENWKALLAVGRIHQEAKRFAEALQVYNRALAIHPDYTPALVSVGECYAGVNDNAAAQRSFEKAMEVDPQCADAANQLGLLAAASENYPAARQWLERAIASQRDHAGAINNLGVLYAKTGQTKDAIAAFRYGIGVAPDDETLYLNLGRIYMTMGDREQAREVLARLLERKPGNPVAVKALAELDAR